MTIEMIDKAFNERRNAQEALGAFYAEINTDDMSAEEVEKETRLSDAISEGQKRERRLIDQMRTDADIDKARAAMPVQVEATGRTAEPVVSEARQLESFLRGESAGNSDRGRAFEVGVQTRDAVELAKAATDGLELVPQTMHSSIWDLVTHESSILQTGPTIVNTVSGEKVTVPRVTSNSAAALVAETVTGAQDVPQFGTVDLDAYKYMFLMQVSSELMADSAFNVTEFVTRHGAAALGRGINTAFITGSGSSQPQGVDLATVGKQIATTIAPTDGELIDLVHSVSPPSRMNAVWLLHDTVIANIRKIDVATNNMWQPGLAAGQPDNLLGAPVYADPNLSTTASNGIIGVYGDMRGFFIRMAGGFRIERSDEFAFGTDESTFRFAARVDSAIVDTVGIRTLQDPT